MKVKKDIWGEYIPDGIYWLDKLRGHIIKTINTFCFHDAIIAHLFFEKRRIHSQIYLCSGYLTDGGEWFAYGQMIRQKDIPKFSIKPLIELTAQEKEIIEKMFVTEEEAKKVLNIEHYPRINC